MHWQIFERNKDIIVNKFEQGGKQAPTSVNKAQGQQVRVQPHLHSVNMP